MKTLKYINSLGAEITFKQSHSAPFILKKFNPKTSVNIYSSKGSGQNGSTYFGNDLNEGDLPLEFAIKTASQMDYLKLKKKLYQLFNPLLGEGRIVYFDGLVEKTITCIPEELPFIVDINTHVGEGTIDLTAHNPFWTDLTEQKHEITLWVPNFSFPLELSSEGMEIGYRSEILTANANNVGDVETGMRIVFKALASVTNPSLVNINTKEQIKINTTMLKGQTITITTGYGEKRVISKMAGIESNLFNSLAAGSTFLQLAPGDNLFRYNADDGIDYLSVTIYHSNRYLGV